ncbi:tetratricopeptide repeat protein [Mucilaginibacter achroorhodeus]|uniref:Tetratricopeptide repeat protein n=1 Tax=Mucilaginibacter achroorhodeus TaxID=2599294 RepID=A0A563UB96_9SPHI|nr:MULTISPECIES: tetratricopeptide repeat protein [Mucilaginibacter]QXV66349.1 tetratricopeptide repeat protein [Mucilaginibacter sp. 21P]TWR28529.1 tetratricopeptide repeat protein [Mucilaginibacter achroorhodeus]
MRTKQIVVTVAVIAVMGYLYALPVKGFLKPKENNTQASAKMSAAKPKATLSAEAVSAMARQGLAPAQLQQISVLENKLKTAGDAEKAALQKQLAKAWDAANQAAPAGFYYLDLARKTNAPADWIAAGNRFNTAYKLTQDTTAQGTYIVNATEAFNHANQLQPDNLEVKTGLGTAYVNGGGMPMQGIALLLDVVKKDPTNHEALLNLGMFSMKSGQYEKAVERFKTLIAQKEEVEPYFYLAESYKQLGRKEEAIAAYEKCKQLMGDPVAGQRIDEYIKELKK